jgi:hypothetical protein
MPFMVIFDHPTRPPVRTLEGSNLFAPPPDNFTNKYLLLNPIIEMIDQPNPIRQQILFHLYDKGSVLTVGDLFNLINAQRNDIEKELLALQSEGLVEIDKPSTRYCRIVKLKDDVDIFEEHHHLESERK